MGKILVAHCVIPQDQVKRVYNLATSPIEDYLNFMIPPMHRKIEICKYTFEMYQLCLDSLLLGGRLGLYMF